MSHNRPQTGQSRNMNAKALAKSSSHNAHPSRRPQPHGSTMNGTVTRARTDIDTISEQQDSWIKARQIRQQQLLTEHFGFSPLSFVDDVINSVNNMIYQASMALQEYIEAQMDEMIAQHELPDSHDVKIESAKSMHQFETLLESSVDKNFDRFELYALKNLFGVPEDVDIVLPHYESLDFNIKVEREQNLDSQLEVLRRKVIAVRIANTLAVKFSN
ncbi:hypothetical protein BGZ76_003897 [Entomortierella beljakovae]|nr:hypothetical protein BGZ76_003897 [Entomortierella beljakovae]